MLGTEVGTLLGATVGDDEKLGDDETLGDALGSVLGKELGV